jgi:hypothetical protein
MISWPGKVVFKLLIKMTVGHKTLFSLFSQSYIPLFCTNLVNMSFVFVHYIFIIDSLTAFLFCRDVLVCYFVLAFYQA